MYKSVLSLSTRYPLHPLKRAEAFNKTIATKTALVNLDKSPVLKQGQAEEFQIVSNQYI
jgi:hypothetical protein